MEAHAADANRRVLRFKRRSVRTPENRTVRFVSFGFPIFRNAAMLPAMKPFLIRWLVTTIAVAVAVNLPGIHAEGWVSLVCMALFLGIINAVIRPVLLVLSFPFIIVTLGFFILIVNTLTFWLAGGLVPGFHIDGFWNAFFGSIVVSIISWALSSFTRGADGQIQVITYNERIVGGAEKRVEGRVIE
jgi:putative membrane protein